MGIFWLVVTAQLSAVYQRTTCTFPVHYVCPIDFNFAVDLFTSWQAYAGGRCPLVDGPDLGFVYASGRVIEKLGPK